MNFLKTTTLLTVMTLIVVFTAQALGFSLISSLFFAFLFNFIMYFNSAKIALASVSSRYKARDWFYSVACDVEPVPGFVS